MNKKYIKIGIIFIVVVIILLVIKVVLKNNTKDSLIDYVISHGYTLNQDGLYEKYNSSLTKDDFDYYVSINKEVEYTKDTFDSYNFQMIRDSFEYKDKLTSNLIATYDYKDSTLIYTYRVTGDNVNVLYMGDYNNQKFTCEKGVSSGVLLNSDTLMCQKIELSIMKYDLEARTFFKNANLANYMKEK